MLKTKNLQNVPPGQPERATELFVPASYEALVESYRQFSFSPAARALAEAYETVALQEAITTALQKADDRLLWLSVASPLRGGKSVIVSK